MTPRQLLALSRRKLAALKSREEIMKGQLAMLYDLAEKTSTEISEAREAVKERLIDEDGESDERDEEILNVLDEDLYPPESEYLDLHEDWDTGMKRFEDGIAKLEEAIESR